MPKRPRESDDQQTQPDGPALQNDSQQQDTSNEPENKRVRSTGTSYFDVMSEGLRFLRLSARSEDADDDDEADIRDDSINQQMRLLIEEYLVEYEQLRREAITKLRQRAECAVLSDEQLQAIFDSLPIFYCDIDTWIVNGYNPLRDLACDEQWQPVPAVFSGGWRSDPFDEDNWRFLILSIRALSYFVVQVSHAFYAEANGPRLLDNSVRNMGDLKRFLMRHLGHPKSWVPSNDVINTTNFDGYDAEMPDKENGDGEAFEKAEREDLDEGIAWAQQHDDPLEIDVVTPKYSFDSLELMSGELSSALNPLAALLDLFATYDALEQLRMDTAGDEDAFTRGMLELSDLCNASLLSTLNNKVNDRQTLEPYFQVLERIVNELTVMESVVVATRAPQGYPKRQYEFWVPVISRVVANEFAVHEGDDEEQEIVEQQWNEQYENQSNCSDDSADTEDDTIVRDDLSEGSEGEIMWAPLKGVTHRLFQLGDFRFGRPTEQRSTESEGQEEIAQEVTETADGATEVQQGAAVELVLPEEQLDLYNLDKPFVSLVAMWSRDNYRLGQNRKRLENNPIPGHSDLLDTVAMGKSIVSRFAYTKQEQSEGPLMDQNWADEADETIDSTGSLARLVSQTQGTDSLLPSLVRLLRRCGCICASAQSLGEATMSLRDFLHNLIGKIIELKNMNQDGDENSSDCLNISDEDVINATKSLNSILGSMSHKGHNFVYNAPIQSVSEGQIAEILEEEKTTVKDCSEKIEFCDEEACLAEQEDVLSMPQRLLEAPMTYYHLDSDEDIELLRQYDIVSAAEQVREGVHKDIFVPASGAQLDEPSSNDEEDEEYLCLLESLEDISAEEKQHLREISIANDDEVKFYVDKRALRKASPVFSAMLASGMQESSDHTCLMVQESITTADQLRLFLQYILDGNASALKQSCGGEDCIALHQAALFYQMPSFVSRLESIMIQDLNPENVIDLFIYGDMCERTALTQAAEQFLRTLPEERVQSILAEAKQHASSGQHCLHDIEWDYLYLVGTKTTLENVTMKLHDVLQLEEENAEAEDNKEEAEEDLQESSYVSPDGDDIDDPDEDLASRQRRDADEDAALPGREVSPYVKRMLTQRFKEQMLWVIIRNYDRVVATKSWRSNEYLSPELKEHIGELVHAYRYGVPSDLCFEHSYAHRDKD